MALKISILSLTCSEYSDAIFQQLKRGKQQAESVYKNYMRQGSASLQNHPVFKNCPQLLSDIIDATDWSDFSLVKQQEEGPTSKFLLKTHDKLEIESVLIPMQAGGTLCISSQVGCRMGCAFCETGRMGLIRHLTTAEIIGQVFVARHILKFSFRNIVFMGMGEPFDNFEEVMKASRILMDPHGFGFGRKNITISTSGCVEGIDKLTEMYEYAPNLAVSINAPNDEIRNKLMPVNRKYNMQQLHSAMQNYCKRSGRQILIAYVLIKGVNDSLEYADQLAQYLQNLDVKINLIPYNAQSRDRFQPSDLSVIEAFACKLRSMGFYTLLRLTKGRTIMAACGQLGNLELRKQLLKSSNSKIAVLHEPLEADIIKVVPNPSIREDIMSRKTKAAELERSYDINVTGRNVLVTDAMKNYAMEKISKIERFTNRIIDVNVIMDIQKLQQRVDILCWVNNMKVKASAATDNMYASIDKAVDKLTEQLLKHKNRMQDHHSTTHEEIAMNENVYTPLTDDELLDINEAIEEKYDKEVFETFRPHKIVNSEARPLKTLNLDEAILKMDLSRDHFMIFQNEASRAINVIYRRGDGNYGIVEPQQ